MRGEVFSSVGEQDMDSSGYRVSHPEDVEFQCEDLYLNMDAVFRPGINSTFSPSTFTDYEMCSLVEKPSLIDKEQDKVNTLLLFQQIRLRETNPVPCVDKKSARRNKKWECTQICLKKFVWINFIIVTVSVF